MPTKITSKIVDADTGNAVSNANISIVDIDGETVKVLQSADSNGNFTVASDAVPYWDDLFVQASAVGYASQAFLPEAVPAKINLAKDVKALGNVVVKSILPKKKGNYILPIALGSAALVSFGVFFYKQFS